MPEQHTDQKIILSADSTCDLDADLKGRYHVHYYPLHIILNGKDYKDNVDITPEQVYQEYYDHKTLPKTAAVNTQEYLDHFRPWVEDGYEVIHINPGQRPVQFLSELPPCGRGAGACPCRGQLQPLHRDRSSRRRGRKDDRTGNGRRIHPPGRSQSPDKEVPRQLHS